MKLPATPSQAPFEPMPGDSAPTTILETLLKHPGRIIHELHQGRWLALSAWLVALALLGMAGYGVVVGSLSGGIQMLIAPTKMALGTFLATLICLPSLYIFVCLSGIEARIRTVCGVLFAAVCLSALLLIGFAPVAWVFSQSTDSLAFMGALHLIFWLIGIVFGLRLLQMMNRFLGQRPRGHLRIWGTIFVLVCLQMTTTLRPIIGKSPRFFPAEKKFFVAHWMDTLTGRASR